LFESSQFCAVLFGRVAFRASVQQTCSTMLAPVRHQRIVEEVERAGAIRVGALAALLGVSEMTVRRDLDVLARRGLLAKVHGGATTVDRRSAEEPGFERKSVLELSEKQAIAADAASLVEPGMAVALTAGTTTWTLAEALRGVPDLTIVTNSVRIADVLREPERVDRTVVLTGGVRTPSDALVGPVAAAAIRSLHVDVVFMGAHGLHPDAGLTTPNLLEAETNRAFVEAAGRLVVPADHTKWGVVGLSEIVPLGRVDVLVSDSALPRSARTTLAKHVGELRIARGRAARRVA
jgi:DeoR/GlpR family transcriptional regulator of sugar metabolism